MLIIFSTVCNLEHGNSGRAFDVETFREKRGKEKTGERETGGSSVSSYLLPVSSASSRMHICRFHGSGCVRADVPFDVFSNAASVCVFRLT